MPTSDYLTTGGTYASSYTWEITPSDAGTITGNTITGTATWNPAYTGPASIKVQGVNSCGGGSFSTEFVVTVDVGVGIAEPESHSLFSLVPNPARSQVALTTNRNINASISVYNAVGALVMNISNQSINVKYMMDISSLTPGVYFMNLRSDEGNQIMKLVVK
jgi:hypothetical protein